MVPVNDWDASEQPVVDVLEAWKMYKYKDLNNFDKGHTMIARQLGQNISQTIGLVGCSQYAVVCTYQKWYKERQLVDHCQGYGCPRLTNAHGKWMLPSGLI